MTGKPFSLTFSIRGASSLMPGLFITSSASRISSSECFPCSHLILYLSRIPRYFSLMVPLSDTKTSNPSFSARTAEPAPLSPAPSIAIFFFIQLSDLQCNNTYYCQYYGHYPEPCDNC